MKSIRDRRLSGTNFLRTLSVLSGLILCLILFCASVSADSAQQDTKLEPYSGQTVETGQAFDGVSAAHALSKPTGLRVVCKGLGKLLITWNSVRGARYYALYEKSPGRSSYYKVGNIYGTGTYALNNFRAGKKYYYKIRAFGSSGSSAYSRTMRCIPREKARKITRSVSGKKVKLSMRWIPTAKAYQIARKAGSGRYRGIATTSKRTYTDKKTKAGTTYYYRYRAVYKYQGRTMYGAWSPSVRVRIGGGGSGGGRTVYRALLIGNGTYRYASNLQKAPGKDVEVMKKLLKGRGYSRITVKKNLATKKAFLNAIKNAFSGAKSTDVSLFLYSGHGVCPSSDPKYAGALCPTDGYWTSDMLTLGELAGALRKVPGKVIILLSSCGSGGGIYKSASGDDFDPDAFNLAVTTAFGAEDEYVPESGDDISSKTGELRKNKFYVITASGHKEYSWSINGRGSLFTMALVNGSGYNFDGRYFTSGRMAADSNGDNKLSMKEAYSYIRSKTLSSQHARAYPMYSSQVILKK